MENSKKRGQHFVHRHYLESWATNGQIYCLQERSNIFLRSTGELAKKRDFYTIQEWTSDDIAFVRDFVIGDLQDGVKSLAINHLNSLTKTFNNKDFNAILFEEDFEKTKSADIVVHNYIENLHHNIESIGIPYLKNIRNMDISFYEKDGKSDFDRFVMVQYLRTFNFKKRLMDCYRSSEIKNLEYVLPQIENTWSLVAIIRAVDLAFSMPNTMLTMHLNNTKVPLITSDQPVINLRYDYSKFYEVSELEVYYPITPKIAIILAEPKEVTYSKCLNENDVLGLNDKLVSAANIQVYASEEKVLKRYLKE